MTARLYSIKYVNDLEDKVKRLEGWIKLLRMVLTSCEEKLEIYRNHSDGQYHGGAEHTSLIGRIKTAMAFTEGKDGD